MKIFKSVLSSVVALFVFSLVFTACKGDDPKPATTSQLSLTVNGKTYTYIGDQFTVSYNIFSDAIVIEGKKADAQTYQSVNLDSSHVTIVLPNASQQAKAKLMSGSKALTADLDGSLTLSNTSKRFLFANKKGEDRQAMTGAVNALDMLTGKIQLTSEGSLYNESQEPFSYSLTLAAPGFTSKSSK